MSFWAGVVQGVKDIDVLKEKEALADERQSVRAEEAAYRDRMDAVEAKRLEAIDARALSWRREDQGIAAEEATYRRGQDELAADERAAAAAYRAKIDDRNFDWGKEVFWVGQDRTDASIALDMKKWDYNVAQDEAKAILAATDRETDQERYDFQVERLGQLDLINEAAVKEDSRRYGIAQERLELMDIREDARIAKDDDRYAIAQSRIDRLDAQDVERYGTAQGRLDKDQQRKDLLTLGTGANPLSLTGGAAGGSPRATSGGSPSASGTSTTGQRSLNAVIARARNIYGASDEALVPFLGHGLSAGAIDEVLNEYDKFKETFAGKPGSIPSVDEFLSDSKIAFTPGAEVTEEMVIAGAKALGVSLTDQYLNTGSTWEDAITAQLKRQAGNGAYDFSTPSTPSTLDFSEVNEITTAAMGEVESYLNQNVRILRKAINDGDVSQAPALTAAEAALKKFKDKTDTMEAVNLVGADVILPMLANAPQDALGGNNFGKFNAAIASRTYPNQASVLAAFKNGELSEDSWYVIDKTIYQVNPEGMKAAASGPLVQAGGQGNLGDAAGTLPGEGGVTEPLDLTGMSSQEMYGAILSGGLVVGDAIVVDGNVDYVTERTIEAANRLNPKPAFATGKPEGDSYGIEAGGVMSTEDFGVFPKGPLTVDKLRAETEANLGGIEGGVSNISDAVESTVRTIAGNADQSFAGSLSKRSSLLQGVTATTAALFDKFGLREQADRLYGNVLDIKNNQAEAEEVGIINQMLESTGIDEWFSKGFESGWLKPEDVTNNPAFAESLTEMFDYVNGPANLDIEQTRLAPEDLQSTVSTGDNRPVVEGTGDLAKPSALDNVTSPYVTSKGAPLAPEEELAVGIEAIVKGLSGNGMDQAELDALIIEMQEKFGDEKVQEALVLAMNQ